LLEALAGEHGHGCGALQQRLQTVDYEIIAGAV